jgi:hypothetical protein
VRRLSLLVLLAARVAAADPDLRLAHAPSPKHLKMRQHLGRADHTPHDLPRVPVPPPPVTDSDPIGGIGGLRDPAQPVTFQLDAGYAIDGTEASSTSKTLAGRSLNTGGETDYARIRTYGFSDAYVGTHGVGVQPLQTFFAARLELAQPLGNQQLGAPSTIAAPLAPPIADWFNANNAMIRSGWAELHDFSDSAWLAPLRVRVGEQYIYGPWVTHIRGGLAAWEGHLVQVQAYAGVRAPDYATYNPLTFEQPFIGGGSARIDLRGISGVPVAFTGRYMYFGTSDGTPGTNHITGEVDWRPARGVVVRSETRALDGELVNEHVEVRTKYRQVTNLVLDAVIRSSDDWRWDPSLTQEDAVGEAKRYLDLGPVVPQVVLSGRIGTVVADNVDLLARAAGAINKPSVVPVASSPPYYELAGAADLRLRRTVTLGASILGRVNTGDYDNVASPVVDVMPGFAEQLPDTARLGAQGFVEGGVSAKMSLGARRFSAMVEVYARRTRYREEYCEPGDTGGCSALAAAQFLGDSRGGGRFTVDAWLNKHLRMFAAYDVSSAIQFAPEITGYKSLRLVMEGVY